MPITMLAFLIGSLSIIGLPPFGGAWSKWTLALGALEAGQTIVVGVLMLSSLLSVGYLLPIVARGFFLPAPGTPSDGPTQIEEAPVACLIALSATAALTIVLFFFAGIVETLLAGVSAGAKP
jgi:multicomponent Na+:H+ antiporter subunit D